MAAAVFLLRNLGSKHCFRISCVQQRLPSWLWRGRDPSCRTLSLSSAIRSPNIAPTQPTLTTSYVHGACNLPLISKTVGQCLEESANQVPDKEALVFVQDNIRKTFGQLKQEVDQLAAGLLAIGLSKGDRLGMWGPNVYEWALVQFATAQAGIILVTVNPAYQARELEYALKKVGCKAVVFLTKFKTQLYYDILKQICPELEQAFPGDLKSKRLPDLKSVIVIGDKPPGTYSFEEVFQAGSASHREQLFSLQKKISCDDPINIQFTSGTTGNPKGATLTHHNIVNNCQFTGHRMGYHWRETRLCASVPLYHCFGCVASSLMMSVFNCTVVYSSRSFEAKAVLQAIQKERCTIVYGTPMMYIDLINQRDLSTYDLSSLQAGVVGGSFCPAEVLKNIMKQMNIIEVIIGYGMTETSPVVFQGFNMDEFTRKTETVGYISPHTECKIVDPQTGMIQPLDKSGELLIRGYCVMRGYWNDEEKTKESLTPDHWLKTGDLASLDEYGYCRILGRIKDMIIRGGENIYPVEIEEFLHTHPKVQEVQVIGLNDERMGEEVCACIQVKQGLECTTQEIKDFCKGQISHFKIPRYIVFVKEMPVTVTGKWPYCERRCTYCNFNKYIQKEVDQDLMRECLVRETQTLLRISQVKQITSVFFGGGTPSLASPSTVGSVLETVAKAASLASDAEISLEANPRSAAASRLARFKEVGVNRLSLGVQALSDADLLVLGRDHTAQEALWSLGEARALFPGRTSVDLLFGRPGQTPGSWEAELRELLLLCDRHLSLYQLTLERGTALFRQVGQKALRVPGTEAVAAMYRTARTILRGEGFHQYEVSNFARKGAVSIHNMGYWQGKQYIGVGPGAHGRFVPWGEGNSRREARIQTLEPDIWMREVRKFGHATRKRVQQTPLDMLEEKLVLGLRMSQGITHGEWLQSSAGLSLWAALGESQSVQDFLDQGLLILDHRGLRCTWAGLALLDSLLPTLLHQLHLSHKASIAHSP